MERTTKHWKNLQEEISIGEMKLQNNIFHHLINLCTYTITRMRSDIHVERKSADATRAPLFVTGMFRSGTTLTTKILAENGFDIGPRNHLLQGIGKRKENNPDGFFENYLFMSLSQYIFSKSNSWGDHPPAEKALENFHIDSIPDRDFQHFSIVDIHDDRIPNKFKMNLLENYCPSNIYDYLAKEFHPPFVIKNPHFALMHQLFEKHFPNANFLVVFRHPETAIASAKKITLNANYALYVDYYKNLLADENPAITFFSYENLVMQPEKSVEALIRKYNLKNDGKEKSIQFIDKKKAEGLNTEIFSSWPSDLKTMYAELLKRAIN